MHDVRSHRELYVVDRYFLGLHELARSMGIPCGIRCQQVLWLDGRVDGASVRAALVALARRHPLLVSRLAETTEGPCWRWREGAEVDFTEASLSESDEASLNLYLVSLWRDDHDLALANPIRFQLLHLPGGHDVFVVCWTHALMDGRGPETLLLDLDALHAGRPLTPPALDAEVAHAVEAYVGKVPRRRRVRVGFEALMAPRRARLAGANVLYLVDRPPPDRGSTSFRVVVSSLDEATTAEITARTRRTRASASVGLAVLASALRAIGQLSTCQVEGGDVAATFIPITLRPPSGATPFQNAISTIPLRATVADFQAREALVKTLATQVESAIRRRRDVAWPQVLSFLASRDRIAGYVRDRLVRHAPTLGFGFHGTTPTALESLFGRSVTRMYAFHNCPAIMRTGMWLDAHVFRRRLTLTLGHAAEAVPDGLARSFVDRVLEDLVA